MVGVGYPRLKESETSKHFLYNSCFVTHINQNVLLEVLVVDVFITSIRVMRCRKHRRQFRLLQENPRAIPR